MINCRIYNTNKHYLYFIILKALPMYCAFLQKLQKLIWI